MSSEAGRGDHHVYRILLKDSSDECRLTARNHYISVEAVAWYINKTNDWFNKLMVSGTLDIELSGGLEKYQAALGTFELASGAKTAPVFDKPVLNDRNYRGGPISFTAMLSAIRKDTVIGIMLNSAASASLGIVAGMVNAATLSGPPKILAAAGEDIISSVRKVLCDTGASREPIFDFTGLGFAIRPESIVGPQTFLLLYRGAALDEAKLTVGVKGRLLVPFYNGVMLDDGAWLLLRIRRSEEYSGVREWFEDAKKLRGRIKSLVDDFEAGFLTKDDGLAQLKSSSTGDKTLLDEFFRLRSIINNDGVLSEREAGLYVGQLYTAILAAKKAISGNGSGQKPSKMLTDAIESTSKALSQGQKIDGVLGKAFEEQVTSVAKLRSFSIVRDTDPDRIANLSGDEVFKTMQYMPKALERSLKFQ
jgi:hypothetical protein